MSTLLLKLSLGGKAGHWQTACTHIVATQSERQTIVFEW
jgi:hypothetical protein